jgi:hypothetical protein
MTCRKKEVAEAEAEAGADADADADAVALELGLLKGFVKDRGVSTTDLISNI